MRRESVNGIIIHHSAVWSKDTDNGESLKYMSTDPTHLRNRGIYSRAEYGYIVAKNGKVIQCVDDYEITGHCGDDDYNSSYIGISCDGYYEGVDGQTMPKTQMFALVNLLTTLVLKYKIPLANIKPHRSVMSTACPGSKFPWWQMIAQIVIRTATHFYLKIGSDDVEIRQSYVGISHPPLIVKIPSKVFISGGKSWMKASDLKYIGLYSPVKWVNQYGNTKLSDITLWTKGLLSPPEWRAKDREVLIRFLKRLASQTKESMKGALYEY